MIVRRHSLLLLLFLLVPALALAQTDGVRLESIAQVEIEVVNAQGQKMVQRQLATLVVPGTVVIYTNRFTNEGAKPATGLVITNPVPEQMVFLPGSLAGDRAEMSFSVDGGNKFAAEDQLFVTDATGKQRAATAEDFTHIRWKLLDPLASKAKGSVEFRARLK